MIFWEIKNEKEKGKSGKKSCEEKCSHAALETRSGVINDIIYDVKSKI